MGIRQKSKMGGNVEQKRKARKGEKKAILSMPSHRTVCPVLHAPTQP